MVWPFDDDLPRSSADIEWLEGDPYVLRVAAGDLRSLAGDLDLARTAAAQLQSLAEGTSWQGAGFDAYRTKVEKNPKASDIVNAQARLNEAADVVDGLASGIEDCQSRIEWCRSRLDALDIPQDRDVPEELRPPVNAIRDDAIAAREDYERHLRNAGDRFAAMTDQTIYAEPPPGLFDQVTGFAGDAVEFVGEFAIGVVEGVVEIVKGLASVVALVVQPWKWDEALIQFAEILHYARTNPREFFREVGKAVVDWETLKENPGRWLGKLVPGIALAITSGGAGVVATGLARSAALTSRFSRLSRLATKLDNLGGVARRVDDVANVAARLRRGPSLVGRALTFIDNLISLPHRGAVAAFRVLTGRNRGHALIRTSVDLPPTSTDHTNTLPIRQTGSATAGPGTTSAGSGARDGGGMNPNADSGRGPKDGPVASSSAGSGGRSTPSSVTTDGDRGQLGGEPVSGGSVGPESGAAADPGERTTEGAGGEQPSEIRSGDTAGETGGEQPSEIRSGDTAGDQAGETGGQQPRDSGASRTGGVTPTGEPKAGLQPVSLAEAGQTRTGDFGPGLHGESPAEPIHRGDVPGPPGEPAGHGAPQLERQDAGQPGHPGAPGGPAGPRRPDLREALSRQRPPREPSQWKDIADPAFADDPDIAAHFLGEQRDGGSDAGTDELRNDEPPTDDPPNGEQVDSEQRRKIPRPMDSTAAFVTVDGCMSKRIAARPEVQNDPRNAIRFNTPGRPARGDRPAKPVRHAEDNLIQNGEDHDIRDAVQDAIDEALRTGGRSRVDIVLSRSPCGPDGCGTTIGLYVRDTLPSQLERPDGVDDAVWKEAMQRVDIKLHASHAYEARNPAKRIKEEMHEQQEVGEAKRTTERHRADKKDRTGGTTTLDLLDLEDAGVPVVVYQPEPGVYRPGGTVGGARGGASGEALNDTLKHLDDYRKGEVFVHWTDVAEFPAEGQPSTPS